MKILLWAIAFVALVAAEKTRFDNYRVYSINIENEVQLKALQELENSDDSVKDLL